MTARSRTHAHGRAVAKAQRRVTAAEAARRRAAAGRLFIAPHDAHVTSWIVRCWNLIEWHDPDEDGPLTAQQSHDLAAFDAWRARQAPADGWSEALIHPLPRQQETL